MKDAQHANLSEKEVYAYCEKNSQPLDELLQKLERETHLKTLAPQMLSGHLQGHFLEEIAHLSGATRALEIGTFTGFSAICIARGLQGDGQLITLEANPEFNPIAVSYFRAAGLDKKIIPMVGDALEIIPELDGTFDLVFIDANKKEYLDYYHAVLPKVRIGGLILVDNVLWDGKVLNPKGDNDAEAIVAFNEYVRTDAHVRVLMTPLRDGLSMIRKIK